MLSYFFQPFRSTFSFPSSFLFFRLFLLPSGNLLFQGVCLSFCLFVEIPSHQSYCLTFQAASFSIFQPIHLTLFKLIFLSDERSVLAAHAAHAAHAASRPTRPLLVPKNYRSSNYSVAKSYQPLNLVTLLTLGWISSGQPMICIFGNTGETQVAVENRMCGTSGR